MIYELQSSTRLSSAPTPHIFNAIDIGVSELNLPAGRSDDTLENGERGPEAGRRENASRLLVYILETEQEAGYQV